MLSKVVSLPLLHPTIHLAEYTGSSTMPFTTLSRRPELLVEMRIFSGLMVITIVSLTSTGVSSSTKSYETFDLDIEISVPGQHPTLKSWFR